MNLFIKRYRELGHDLKPIHLQHSIRTNTLKISNNELKQRLEERGVKIKKIPFTKNGFYVKSRFSIGSTPEYLQGYYYIQEAASQLPAELLTNKKIVVDCCAAPGGKTTQLAVKTEIVLAFEKNHKRLQTLINNLERLGINNTKIYNYDARTIREPFQSILVDAPCSGNFIKDPEWLKKQTLKNIQERSELQKEILGNMLTNLEEGGELVYSTCSLEPEENEAVINWAIHAHNVKLQDIDTIGSPGITSFQGKQFDKSIKKCRRLWPDVTKTQGFFIAKFKK